MLLWIMQLIDGLQGGHPSTTQIYKCSWGNLTLWMYGEENSLMIDPSLGATGLDPGNPALISG